jgi:hypothetical protein
LEEGVAVDVLVAEAIAGIEAGKSEIRPVLSNVLYLLSRRAAALPSERRAKMVQTAG